MEKIEKNKPRTREAIPKAYAIGQWTPTHYTESEGGKWIDVVDYPPKEAKIVRYQNGWIFDSYLLPYMDYPWRHIDG